MTDTQKWLSRGFLLRQEKEQLERMRQDVFYRLTNVTQSLSDAPASGTKDPHKFDALIALDVEIAAKVKKLDETKLEIFKAIQTLQDRRYRMVLTGRYCENLHWDAIAITMHYDARHVQRLHGEALVAIEPIIAKKIKR